VYGAHIDPRASVLECCGPLQLSRAAISARLMPSALWVPSVPFINPKRGGDTFFPSFPSRSSVSDIFPHNPLISRVLTPLNLNKTFSRSQQRIRRFAQKFARYSHINVNEKLYATNTASGRNSSVPPKIKNKNFRDSHNNVTPISFSDLPDSDFFRASDLPFSKPSTTPHRPCIFPVPLRS